jgi:hypothetical protein
MAKAMTMTTADWAVIKKFRDGGHAIVVFNPVQLGGAPADDVEDRLVELGWDVIDALRTDQGEGEYK